METANIDGVMTEIVEKSEIEQLQLEDELTYIGEAELGETEYNGEGFYKVYRHSDGRQLAAWDRTNLI